MNMWKLDVPQILISASAIFGISLLWYDLNMNVLDTVYDLVLATLPEEPDEYDKD